MKAFYIFLLFGVLASFITVVAGFINALWHFQIPTFVKLIGSGIIALITFLCIIQVLPDDNDLKS